MHHLRTSCSLPLTQIQNSFAELLFISLSTLSSTPFLQLSIFCNSISDYIFAFLFLSKSQFIFIFYIFFFQTIVFKSSTHHSPKAKGIPLSLSLVYKLLCSFLVVNDLCSKHISICFCPTIYPWPY
ncbi:hypothetical protein RND81_03G058900 [Saponaria officinalis]|uniref:Uncharacterized protein n=1 Tax=Saponaria officinalis TaxID=3572 RepID=A0AAW1M503_SAPOF